MLSIMKTRQDNNMTDCTRTVYIENEIELSWLIESGFECDKNQIGQRMTNRTWSVYEET